MEHIDRMKIDKNTLLKIGMMILIIIAIFYQVKIVKMIYDKQEMLNTEPLSYGARKYGIEECTCWVSTNKQIWFNISTSITKIRQNSPTTNYQEINLSNIIIKK